MRIMLTIGTVAALGGLSLHPSGAWAVDLPTRKPGLWEVVMQLSAGNKPPRSMKYCTDAATDAEMFKLGMGSMQEMCSRRDMQRSGNVVTMDATCTMGESTMTSHTVMAFSGDTAYQTNTTSHFAPPMMGRSDSTTTQNARWTGPCPSDMVPGDIIGPTGAKMNLLSTKP